MSAEFYRQCSAAEATSAVWSSEFTAYRQAAAARFAASGWPTQRQEAWKYTALTALERKQFAAVAAHPSADVAAWQNWLLPDAYHGVFIDGHFCAALSQLPEAASVLSAGGDAQRALAVWQALLPSDAHGLIEFNSATFTDGLCLDIPAGGCLDKPLQLLCINTVADGRSAVRHSIRLGVGAQASLIETAVGIDGAAYLNSSVSVIQLAEHAQLTWCSVQAQGNAAYQFNGRYVEVGQQARFEQQSFAFGSLLARDEVEVVLSEAAHCDLEGLYLGVARQHLDQHLRVEHRQPNASSRETYTGILADRARGVFQGRVVVAEQAQHSDAAMQNRNLLLSADAEVDTKPQLEIYADDVKCAHGVTVGQLNPESVFYLCSRGLAEAEARNVLTFAFANERVERIECPTLRAQVRDRLLAQLPSTAIEKAWL